MKCLERNKTPFYYCLYQGEVYATDGEGYETGEKTISYSDPVLLHGNISPARGNISVEQFGNNVQYDKVIVLDDPTCPIDEHSVLFIDKAPAFDESETPLFDYIVKKVARSLNSVSIAISKVEVS